MKKKALYQKIFEELLGEINAGKYRVGDKLPSEKELALQYGVSIITSKQALELLVEQGRIVRKPGLGSFVTEQTCKEEMISQDREEKRKKICVIFDTFDDTFGSYILSSIEHACNQNQWDMMLQCTYGSIDEEKLAISNALNANVSGVIIMCVQDEIFNESILRCSLENFPIVLLDRIMEGVSIPCVTTDNFAAAKELTDCLFERENAHICFVSHQYHETPTIKERLRGFIESNLEHQIIVSDTNKILDMHYYMVETDSMQKNRQEDELRIHNYLKDNPQVTAFFAVQYDLALIIYKVLLKLGLQDKIQIAVFDGPDQEMIPVPVFIRVLQDERAMGVTAVKLLKERMEGKPAMDRVYIPYTIVTP
ncbi:MAG: GntR family transcriptional regulator [Velocimicrobium sp.]